MKLWGRTQGLQRKIIAAIVMVGLIPLILSLVPTYFEERRVLRGAIGGNFTEIAVEAARRIEAQVTRGINEAQQLATTPFLRTAVIEANRGYAGKDEARIQSMIRDWQRRWREREHRHEFPLFVNRIVTNHLIRWHDIRKSDYIGILVTDSQGALVISSIPQVEYYYGKTEWWEAVINGERGEVFVSDLYFDPSFGTHVLNVSVPILDNAEQPRAVGAVTVLLRRDSLFHSISEVTIGATGHAMLMRSDGTPLICPLMSPEEHEVTPALLDHIVSPQAGWAVVANDSHGGRDSLVGFAPVRMRERLAAHSLGGKRWFTFVRQDPDETYTPLEQLLARVAGYGVVVFGVLLVAGVWAARQIVRPIGVLHEGAQRIGAGNLDHQLTLKTGDELEHLADAFNRMAANLKQSFGQLQQRMTDIRLLEEKYRDLIENSPEMIHQINRAGQFVHVNKTELDKLGYSREEMLRMRLWDIVPQGQEREILAYLEQLVSQGRGTIETVFLTREGRPVDVEIHSTALFDPDGGLIHSRAFVRDITQRKLLEQKVQQYTTQLEQEVADRTQQLAMSQKRYKALFDLAADSVFMVGQDGDIVAVNAREEQALGYSESQAVGTPFLEVVLPAYHDVTRSLLAKIIQGERQVPTEEIEVQNRAGAPVPVEMDLIRIDDGAATSVMVQLRDITERKRLEQQLQEYSEELEVKVRERTREIEETKQYLENLLENANDVIYTLDTEQNFTYVNSKVEAWGYRKEDLIGRPYLSLLSKRHRGRRLKSTLDIGVKQVYEVELMTRTGQPCEVMVSVSPLRDAEGRISGVLGIARDITETKRLEQQIRSSEKLASVGKLAAGVAHEINNPLGGILNCLYNFRKGTLSAARQEEYLASIEDGLRRVQKIVRQLLDFSQQHEPECSPTNINAVVERVLVLTDPACVANSIRVERQLQTELPDLLVDRHMIEQVLMNLVLNAVQAIRGGGVIRIRTRTEVDRCKIDVEDTGCGIPPSILPHIFDPFFTTKGTGEGTGLGLSVSMGIVERHGGQILVESEVRKGTVFTVCLPLARERSLVGRTV